MLGGNAESMAKQVNEDVSSEDHKIAEARFKTQCDAEKKEVIAAGGLYIIGTERHESRRIDNQLRGRSGRQGDPGESRFYLSLDDDLMRKFNGERIQKIMNQLNVPDEEPIMAGMVTRSIESAQRRVEGHNFDIRKHLLEYDDVMNKQRQVVYGLRRDVLLGLTVDDIVKDMLGEVTTLVLDTFVPENGRREDWNIEGLGVALTQQFGATLDVAAAAKADSASEVTELVKAAVNRQFENQKAHLGPYFPQVEKMLLLQAIDQRWKEHLQRIDQLREWINLRAYAQKDPLVEYKQEAFNHFQEFNDFVKTDTMEKLFKIQLVLQQQPGGPEGGGSSEPTFTQGNASPELAGGSAPLRDQSGTDENEEDIDNSDEGMEENEMDESVTDQLDALKPKRQRLVFSGGDTEPDPRGGGSRNTRRAKEKDKKKKLF